MSDDPQLTEVGPLRGRSRYGVISMVNCPTCGVMPGWRCRTLTTKRSTETHMARYDAAYPEPACAAGPYPSSALPSDGA